MSLYSDIRRHRWARLQPLAPPFIGHLNLDKRLDPSKSQILAWQTEVVPVVDTRDLIQQLYTQHSWSSLNIGRRQSDTWNRRSF